MVNTRDLASGLSSTTADTVKGTVREEPDAASVMGRIVVARAPRDEGASPVAGRNIALPVDREASCRRRGGRPSLLP
ncbi:hypothetical protein MCHIJ_12730 [Mycolicibacterium chitae]|nr:hypothetical protein MCHIJ_12730 [Mycolicibacterium chitae]